MFYIIGNYSQKAGSKLAEKEQRFRKDFFVIKFLFVCMISLSMLSCTFLTGRSKCERIIEKEKMVEVMTDVYLLEAYIRITGNERPEIRDSTEYFFTGLFKKHEITRETFDDAFKCYSLDRELMEYLNEEVLNAISIIETRMQAKDISSVKNPSDDSMGIQDNVPSEYRQLND